MKPDLTPNGINSLRAAIRMILSDKSRRVDLGHGTIVYKVPSDNPNKYMVRIDMKVEEE